MMTMNYLSEIVLQKLEEKVEFFLNSRLEPMIRVAEDGFQREWPVSSERVLDLLYAIHFEASAGEILRKNQREFLLSQIREKCRRGKRRFSECEADDAETNPVVQAVLCYINDHERFEGRTAILLEILKDSQFVDRLPVAPSTFSRRLRQSIEMLRGFGVEVSISHREDGSHCLISRTESFAIEPDDTLRQANDSDDTESVVSVSSGCRQL